MLVFAFTAGFCEACSSKWQLPLLSAWRVEASLPGKQSQWRNKYRRKSFLLVAKQAAVVESAHYTVFHFCEFLWVCIRGTLLVNHPDTSPTCTLSFPVRSCTFNSTECFETCIPAPATAPFHQLASWPLNPHLMLLFPSQPSLFFSVTFPPWEPDKRRRWSAVRAKALSDVTVWLSRTSGHNLWVCCRVTFVATVCSDSDLSTKYFYSISKAQLHANTTKHLHSIMTDFNAYFVFVLIFNAHPPYMPFQPALWLSLCLSLLACNASWVELWSKHQDKQKAMEKPQSKRLFTHRKKEKKRKRIGVLSCFSTPVSSGTPHCLSAWLNKNKCSQ